MYLEQPRSFAETFQMPEFLEQEREQEAEQKLMKAFYPREALEIQEIIEQECDKLEYEGSIMYDEYPDKYQLEQLKMKICRLTGEMLGQVVDNARKDLTGVLLCHEISRRRCRRRRCRRYF